MRALLLITALLAACGDNLAGKDAGVQDDAAVPDGPPIDTPPQATGACLDRPTDFLMPPTGPLPCEMLPPGFEAP